MRLGAWVLGAGALLLAGAVPLRLSRRYAIVSVVGESMAPTYRTGDRLLVRRVPVEEVRNGDVIVFAVPREERLIPVAERSGADELVPTTPVETPAWMVKRVVAVQGDPVPHEAEGATVPEGCLVVMGDNAEISLDSRSFGHVTADRVLGMVTRRLDSFSQ